MSHAYSEVENSVFKFIKWLENYGDDSYDRMDFWSSPIGVFSKRLFYRNKLLGAPLAALALLQETFFPSLLKLYARPRREAIGDAHYALSFFNLFEICQDKKYLKRGEQYLNALRESVCEGYSGACWGYTFGWETSVGYWQPKTPLITITPYGFWAFKKHWELTHRQASLDVCHSVAQFALNDLRQLKMPNGTICTSYSPNDERYIINANTYRAALLLEAYQLFHQEPYKTAAEENLDFVLSYQQPDGSWYYEAIGTRDRFIDNFHTCFVLRNLYKAYCLNQDAKLLAAIKKGYQFYRQHLFRPDNTPLHFARSKYIKLRKYEMYDYAEGISLGCLLKDEIEGAFEFSQILATDLIRRFQLKDGHFLTRVTTVGIKNKIPYHRWPQAQLLFALTTLLKVGRLPGQDSKFTVHDSKVVAA